MSEPTVLYEVREGVALVTLNRPQRLNAFVTEMQERLFDLLETAANDSEVRAMVVTGAGRGFCAGQDIDTLDEISTGQAALASAIAQRPQTFPMTVPKPIIAAINGACAGLGFVAALMSDVRFAAAGAKFTTAFVRRGLVAEYGISWLLPRIVGLSRAMDLLLSGRIILAEEAFQMGLVDRVVAPERLLDEALDYARDLAANCSPASMATIKAQVYSDAQVDLATAVDRAETEVKRSFELPDVAEGVQSFVEQRPPRFAALPASA
jgi:enoyl-CoA hydratase/carnithine racemase